MVDVPESINERHCGAHHTRNRSMFVWIRPKVLTRTEHKHAWRQGRYLRARLEMLGSSRGSDGGFGVSGCPIGVMRLSAALRRAESSSETMKSPIRQTSAESQAGGITRKIFRCETNCLFGQTPRVPKSTTPPPTRRKTLSSRRGSDNGFGRSAQRRRTVVPTRVCFGADCRLPRTPVGKAPWQQVRAA
jgi:hypothetical protein